MTAITPATPLKKHLGSLASHITHMPQGDALKASCDTLITLLSQLKKEPELLYTQLIDVCIVDYLGQRSERFEVVYHLLSMHHNKRLRVNIPLKDGQTSVPSATQVFAGALWWEREAYDLFGITFENHPDLRRLLTDYDFQDHPLRKDFPLTGFTQVRYDEQEERVVTEPVHLAQAYRTFENLSPWEGIGAHLKHQPPFSKPEPAEHKGTP